MVMTMTPAQLSEFQRLFGNAPCLPVAELGPLEALRVYLPELPLEPPARPPNAFTQQVADELKTAIVEGGTLRGIAADLKVSPTTVLRHKKKLRDAPVTVKREYSTEAVYLLEPGSNPIKTAATVRKESAEVDVKAAQEARNWRRSGGPVEIPDYENPDQIRRQLIWKLRESGMSVEEISIKLECSRAEVGAAIRQKAHFGNIRSTKRAFNG